MTRLLPERRHFAALALAAAAGIAVLLGALLLALAEHAQYEARVRAQVISGVSEKRALLEEALATRLSLVDGVGALALAHGGDVGDEFESFAAGLAGSQRSFLGREGADPALRSLQLAPDAVVTYVWPLEGNEAAIGHSLLDDPVRGPAVQRAIDEGRFILAGPFELLQGGSGLVGRNPIYLPADDGRERFWGFATVVINFDAIAAEAGLAPAGNGELVFALRGRDGLGAAGEVFLGDEPVFAHDPIVMDVIVPNGTWQVGAHPAEGWPVPYRRLTPLLVVLAGLAVAVTVSTAIWRWASTRRTLERVSDDLLRLVHSTGSPIVGVEVDGTVSEWNRAAARLTSEPRSRAVGSPLTDTLASVLASSRDVASLEFAVAEAFAGASSEDVRVTTAGATPAVISFNVTPRSGGDGTIRGAVCIGRDITARLEAERVKAENVAMARSAKLKDEFLAGMSHELRTPLNAIIGLSSVLGRKTFGPLTGRQEAYVQQIGDSGAHLLSLINDVLDLAKINATGSQLDLEEVDVAAMGRTAVAAVAPLAAERGHTVHEPLADPVVIRADRRRVHQVMLNLLSNAVKFMHDGGEMGLEVNSVPEGAEIVVWDRGVGIPDDVRHLLFEPFQQIDGSLAREHDGTGLGLALVAKLVDLHGGRVEVESRPGEGSRFVVTLPLVPERRDAPEPASAPA